MNGHIVTHPARASRFVEPRSIDVWLPPAYTPTHRYAVLYMHDGQMLFSGSETWTGTNWGVDTTMTSLIREKKIREAIVVAIPNQGQFRWSEYLPQGALDRMPPDLRSSIEQQWLMGRPLSDAYLAYIVEELKPFIDSTYSTLTDPANTLIMGSSMGGIISLYALCEYPHVFGGAACLSTHWPLDIPGWEPIPTTFEVPTAFFTYLDAHLPGPGQHRIYFDLGTASLDAVYPPLQLKVDDLLVQKGFTSNQWITKIFPGEEHTETAWARRLHVPLTFLLGI